MSGSSGHPSEETEENNEASVHIYYSQTNITSCSDVQVVGGDATTILSGNQQTASSQPNDEITTQNAAIHKVLEIQKRYQEDDYFLQTSTADKATLPKVCPKMVEAFVYQSNTPQKDVYFPSTEPNYDGDIDAANEITFDDLLNILKQSNFISLVGLPGSGKSILSKRIARSTEICFLIKFENLNFQTEHKLTLQQLILDHNYIELKKEECDAAFEWIKNNEDKCLFILDGYDQVTWNLQETVQVFNYYQPQTIWNLVSNLCNKKYLSHSHILFTSRSHSLLSMPKSVKPDMTILLLDLSFKDMKELFFAFSGLLGQQFWDNLHATAPQLINLCLNPLLLQLVIKACLKSTSSVGEINSMTQVFTLLLDDFRVSSFTHHDDIEALRGQLSSLAYKATDNSTVMMTVDDLKKVGLDIDTVQDLVKSQHTFRDDTCKVFEDEACLYFSQPTFQEYFAACFAYNNMPYQDFKEFVQNKLFTPQWFVIRQFLMGMLRKVDENSEQFKLKRDLVTSMLEEEMAKSPKQRDLIELCCNLRELDDDDVTSKVALNFPTTAGLWLTHVSLSDTHALSYVLKRLKKKIEWLDFGSCNMNSESFVYIKEAIAEMPISIGGLIINSNKLSTGDVDGICSILHKIDDGLGMWNAFVDDNGKRRSASFEERALIQARLDELPSSKLWVYVDEIELLQKHP